MVSSLAHFLSLLFLLRLALGFLLCGHALLQLELHIVFVVVVYGGWVAQKRHRGTSQPQLHI